MKRIALAALPLAMLLPPATASAQEEALTREFVRIVSTSCAISGCHTGSRPARGLDLSAEAAVRATVNVPVRGSQELRLIAPRRPEQSYLLKKVRGDEDIGGMQMPMVGEPLTSEQVGVIIRWIESFPAVWEGGETEGPGPGPPAATVATAADGPPDARFFDGRQALLPTPDPIGRGIRKFDIFHRFEGFLQGSTLYDAYGLDAGANMSLYLGYGLTDDLDLGLRRSSNLKHFEVLAKWRFLRSLFAGVPGSAALYASWGNIQRKNPDPLPKSATAVQVSVGVMPTDWLSLLVVPSWSSGTSPFDAAGEKGTVALGLGAEVRPMRDLALVLESIPVLSGYALDHGAASLGVKYRYGGHTFMLLVTNAVEMHTGLYLPGSIEDPGRRLRLGFNISRRIVR